VNWENQQSETWLYHSKKTEQAKQTFAPLAPRT